MFLDSLELPDPIFGDEHTLVTSLLERNNQYNQMRQSSNAILLEYFTFKITLENLTLEQRNALMALHLANLGKQLKFGFKTIDIPCVIIPPIGVSTLRDLCHYNVTLTLESANVT